MKKNFKKLFVITSVAALFLSTGFGCKNSFSASQVTYTKKATLEYWTVFDDANEIKALSAKYKINRPYFTVNVRQFRADEFYDRLIEALAEDRGPDIISVSNRDLGKYLSKLTPMPAAVQDGTIQVVKGRFGDQTIINVAPRPLLTLDQLGKEYVSAVKGDAVRGGKIYGLPLSLDVMAIYYNKDLLDRAGIAEAPKTWEEFQADVKLLTKFDKPSGKIIQAGAALGTGANVPGSTDLLYILFQQSNLPFVDAGGHAVFNQIPRNDQQNEESPEGSVMNFYTDFANPTRDTYTWNDTMPNALDSFVSGQLAFFFGYSYDYPVIKGRAPQLNFEVMPLLQLSADKPVNVATYYLQTVLTKSKNQNNAWDFIDFLTHSAATKQYLDVTGRPSALRIYVGAQKEKPELAPFASQILTADSWYRGKDFDATDKAVQTMFSEWLQPAPDESRILQWHQGILNRGASKVNQTM